MAATGEDGGQVGASGGQDVGGDFVQLTLGGPGDGSACWWLDGDEVGVECVGAGGDEVEHGAGLRSGEAAGAGY